MGLTVVLADDHEVVRYGLQVLFEQQDDYEVVGEAANGADLEALCQQLRPQIVIMDLNMPGVSGPSLVRQLHEQFPETHIIVLSMYTDEIHVLESFRAGARGYVTKGAQLEEVIAAIQQVVAGGRYLPLQLMQQAIQAYVSGEQTAGGLKRVTTREKDVLYLFSLGMTGCEIGQHLGISPRTVEKHKANGMHKLNLKNQVELVRFFLSLELYGEAN